MIFFGRHLSVGLNMRRRPLDGAAADYFILIAVGNSKALIKNIQIDLYTFF